MRTKAFALTRALILALAFAPGPLWAAKLKVVATTTDVSALVAAVGGDLVEISTITRGTQDPHYIEAKPSYMVKLSQADLLVSNGLALEIGWLPSLVQGSRNPKIRDLKRGHLELGNHIEAINIPSQPLTRAMGDVHPEGNPHFTLDPIRMAELASVLARRMGELDPANQDRFIKNAETFFAETERRVKEWTSRLKKHQGLKVITHHSSLNYFLSRFGLKHVGQLEPKPGVPPSASHILDVISLMKSEKVRLILVDSFFDRKVADRVSREVIGARVAIVGIAVESKPELKTLADVTEQLVREVEKVEMP